LWQPGNCVSDLVNRINGKSKVPFLAGDLQDVPDQDKVVLAGTDAVLDTPIPKQGQFMGS
jgi:hypothetical protein